MWKLHIIYKVYIWKGLTNNTKDTNNVKSQQTQLVNWNPSALKAHAWQMTTYHKQNMLKQKANLQEFLQKGWGKVRVFGVWQSNACWERCAADDHLCWHVKDIGGMHRHELMRLRWGLNRVLQWRTNTQICQEAAGQWQPWFGQKWT